MLPTSYKPWKLWICVEVPNIHLKKYDTQISLSYVLAVIYFTTIGDSVVLIAIGIIEKKKKKRASVKDHL